MIQHFFSITIVSMNMSYLCRPACQQSKISNIPAIYGRAGLTITEPFVPNSVFLLSLYLSLSFSISISIFADIFIFSQHESLALCSSLYISALFHLPPLTSILLHNDSTLHHKTILSPKYDGLCCLMLTKRDTDHVACRPSLLVWVQ